jgi:LPXTG-site transpeptidase (sortase) family protein
MSGRRLALLSMALMIAVSVLAASSFAFTGIASTAETEIRVTRPPLTTAVPATAPRHTTPTTTTTRPKRLPAARALIPVRPRTQPTVRAPTAPASRVPAPARAAVATELPLPASGALSSPAPLPDPYARGPVVQIATVRIPKIGLIAPLYEGVSLTVLNHGPGHWPGTAGPGSWGNVVIGGHRTTYSHPFLNIDWLAPGDEIIFDRPDGSEAHYMTTGTEVVAPTAMWIVQQTPGNTVTLFACHPKGSAAQRIVVHGRLASLRKR